MEIIKDKKKLRRILTSFYILIFLVLFSILVRGITKTRAAWYSSSWLYRRPITITGDGTTYTNLDVLVSIDTATLISEGKLQSSCNDLRFTDSDETTELSYWVEGGCNTSATQVWVRIPSMPTTDKTVYVYYGNSSVTNGELSWSSNFYSFSNQAECGSGWTADTAFNSKYIFGSSTANSNISGTHSHSGSGVIGYQEVSGSVGVAVSQAYDYCGENEGVGYHDHDWEIELGNTTHYPPYYNLLVCYSNKLNADSKIAIFDTTVPTNWTRFSGLDSRFPRGNTSAGSSGGTHSHTHTNLNFSILHTYNLHGVGGERECGSPTVVTENSSVHGHTLGGISLQNLNVYPPYINVIFGESNGLQTVPSGIITGSTALPPLGWSVHNSLDNNRLIRGSTSFGSTGGSSTHTHVVYGTTGFPTNSTNGVALSGNDMYPPTPSHTHPISNTTTTSATSWPDSRSLIFVQKQSSLSTIVGIEETDNSAPLAPTSLLTEGQTNPQKVADLTPEFSAIFNDPDSGDTATSYEIEVNTSSDFSGDMLWDLPKTSMTSCNEGSRCSDISYAGTALSFNGATYYWRIKFWDDAGLEGVWSSAANFTMQNTPTAPTSLLTEGLTNPEAVNDLTPEFSAIFNDPDTGDTATNYEIEVNTSSDFSGTVMWDSNKVSMSSCTEGTSCADISYAGTTLSFDGTVYYWRIKFWDSAGAESEWSEVANFKMQIAPNSPTELLTDGDTNPVGILTLTPTFSAIFNDPNGDDASAYEIEVNSNNTFTGTVMWDTGKTVTSIISGNRSPDYTYAGEPLTGNSGTTYYWRIRFWDSADLSGEWSTVATFEDYLNHQFFEGVQMEGITVN